MIKKIFSWSMKILNFLLIWASFILFFIAIFKKEWFELFVEWMKVWIGWLGSWNYLIVFSSALIEAFPVLGILVPGQNILLIVGGFFGNISKENLIYVTMIASIWAICGNYIWFILGKYFGEWFFEKYWLWFGIGKTEVRYLEKWIEKWGPLGITFGKFHPMTRAFLPFIAWSAKMKSKTFMIYNAIGSITWATTMIVFWVVFVEYYQFFIEYAGTISLVILLLVGLYIYFFQKAAFLKYLQEKNQELEALSHKK